jgi:hypothetical protein
MQPPGRLRYESGRSRAVSSSIFTKPLFPPARGIGQDQGELHLRWTDAAGGPEEMPANDTVPPEGVRLLLQRLDRIEAALAELVQRQAVKDWYSTEEVARLLGKAEFTVREWCRLGRVRAEKKGSGRGKYQAWVVSHDELLRVQREGLLPLKAGA